MAILEKLEDQIPTLPTVIHAFLSDYDNNPAVLNAAAFVVKEVKNVERLKKVVAEILGKLNVEP